MLLIINLVFVVNKDSLVQTSCTITIIFNPNFFVHKHSLISISWQAGNGQIVGFRYWLQVRDFCTTEWVGCSSQGFLKLEIHGFCLASKPQENTYNASMQEVYHNTYMTARLEVEFMHSEMPKLFM